jgi:hypothetical protein
MTMKPEWTVRVEHDASGIWVLRETEDGDRRYHLVQDDNDLCDCDYIFDHENLKWQPKITRRAQQSSRRP